MSERIYLWNSIAPYSDASPEQEQPSLTPYTVNGSKGAVIVLAGGAYYKKTGYEEKPVAEMIQSAGVSAFTLDYRVKPCDKLAPLADCNRAVRLLHSMGYEKVGILGFSAGGNAVCNAATHWDFGNPDADDPVERFSSRPDAFMPCYAVVSFISYTHQGSVKNLLGPDEYNAKWLRYFSAELNVTDDTPEAFIWHCSDDPAVPVECCLNLCSALSAHGVPYEVHIFPNGGHGLGLAESNSSVNQWVPLFQKWLKEHDYA